MKKIALSGLFLTLFGLPFFGAEMNVLKRKSPGDMQYVMLSPKPTTADLKLPAEKALAFFSLRLGDAQDPVFDAAVFESDGNYTFKIDANNNNDLSDDKAHPLQKLGDGVQARIVETVTVGYRNGSARDVELTLTLRGSVNRQRAFWIMQFAVNSYLSANVDIGDRKGVLVGIGDSRGQGVALNACFNDFGSDGFFVDLNGDGKLSPDKERMVLSRVVSLWGELYEVEVDAAGRNLSVKPFTGPTGTLEISLDLKNPADFTGQLFVNGEKGVSFLFDLAQSSKLAIPVGTYTLGEGMLTGKATGRTAQSTALFEKSGKAIVIDADIPQKIELGRPFTLEPVVKGRVARGGTISIAAKITGQAGEEYTTFLPRRAPTVKITKPNGAVIVQGNMQFG